MVNGRVSGDVYQRLVSAGAVGFVSVEGSPLDEGVDRVPCQRSLPMIFPGNAEGEIEGLSESSEDIHEMQENIVVGSRVRIFIIKMRWSW